MMQSKLRIVLALLLILTMTESTIFANASTEKAQIKPYSDVYYEPLNNLTDYDFTNSIELISTLNYSLNTKWPSNDKMPNDFSPDKYIEWGKIQGSAFLNFIIWDIREKG